MELLDSNEKPRNSHAATLADLDGLQHDRGQYLATSVGVTFTVKVFQTACMTIVMKKELTREE